MVLSNAPRWLPEADRHILSSAAESGRLVEGLQVLSQKHAFAAEQRKKALNATLYPLFVVHFGALLVPLHLLIQHGATAYLRVVAMVLGPLWMILALFAWANRRRHRWLAGFLRLVPLLRGYSRNRSLADLCFTLGAYLAAGEGVAAAWSGAGRASGDRRLRKLGEQVAEEARRGIPPGLGLERSRAVPEEFASLYLTGEQTGQLEENVHHLGQLYSERAAAKLAQAGFWYPKLLVILVAIGVAYVVISSYLQYLEEVLRLLEF